MNQGEETGAARGGGSGASQGGQAIDAAGSRPSRPLRIVALGGGTGLPVVLEGLCQPSERLGPGELEGPACEVTGIVTTCDDGGSSGRLRRELGVPAVGDLRNCLAAVAKQRGWAGLMQHRYQGGSALGGHALGNLILAALSEREGGVHRAVERASELLGARARILPATDIVTTLVAELEDGRVVRGEAKLPSSGGRIRLLWLEPSAPSPSPGVLEALAAADLIVIGPGSLYTSIVPNLLVRGVAAVVATSPALKVLVMNLLTEPGETDDFSAEDHLRALRRHAGARICDLVLLHSGPLAGPELADPRVRQVIYSIERMRALGVACIEADLVARLPTGLGPADGRVGPVAGHSGKSVGGGLPNLRHDPMKLAEILRALAVEASGRREAA